MNVFERIAFISVVSVTAMAPLPFGSTHPFFVAIWNLLLGVAALCLSQAELPRTHRQFLMGLFFIWFGWISLIYVQITDAPPMMLGVSKNLWALTNQTLGGGVPPTLSVSRDWPLIAFGSGLANILAFACCFVLAASSANARRLPLVMLCCGTLYAAYAIASFILDPSLVLWRVKEAHVANLTGTFTNRNTAAVFFGLLSILALLILFDSIGARHLSLIAIFRTTFRSRDRMVAGLVLGFIVNLAAMLMTGSRAGSVISMTVLGVAVLIYFRRSLASWKSTAAVVAGMLLVALLLLQTLGIGITERFDVQGFSDEGRKAVYFSTVQTALSSPWFGTGLGTFALIFPYFRGFEVTASGGWNRAHNVPLELAAEVGLIGMAVIVVLYLAVMALVAVASLRRASFPRLIGFCALAIGGAHSLVDFSLQISGFSLFVACFAGVGASRAIVSVRADIKQSDRISIM